MRNVSLIADPHAGLDSEARAAIRNALIAKLANDDVVPEIADPGNELMIRMMRICLGEGVGVEYAPMMLEDLAFTDRDVQMPGDSEHAELIWTYPA